MSEEGLVAALDALGQVVGAYKRRIAELEQLVLQVQSELEATKNSPEENANGQIKSVGEKIHET